MPRTHLKGSAARAGLVTLLLALCVACAGVAAGAPAHHEPFTLQQPDGTGFSARLFGDEWMNGTETVEGYTILQDPSSGYWTFADATAQGTLVPSPYVVGRDLPYALPPRLRPRPADGRPAASRALRGDALEPFVGSKKMLAILVDFADQAARSTAAQWQSTFFGATNSVTHYYSTTSYGALTITPAAESHGAASDGVVGWLRLAGNHPQFGGVIDERAAKLTRDAMTAAAVYVDFGAFDTNGDHVVSESELMVVVIVAGLESSFSPVCGRGVWAHQSRIPPLTLDGVQLSPYAMLGEMLCDDMSGLPITLGPIVHETGHLLGLPDLSPGNDFGVGRWSVMGLGFGNGLARTGDTPALMDPWGKIALGWLTPIQVTEPRPAQAIASSASPTGTFKLLTGDEYFLVENRQATGYDAGLPASGLIIWHVAETKPDNTEQCIPGGSPACSATFHPKVRLIQADNRYDIEKHNSVGDTGDPFPGWSSRRAFGSASTPNSRRYSGAASGVSVTDISDSAATMAATLSVTGNTHVTITTPNGGEVWPIGTSQTIQWTSRNAPGRVKIDLSRDGGATWAPLVTAGVNDGSQAWSVKAPATGQARIRICSVAMPALCDTSRASFAIGRTLTLTVPNGGTTWRVNTAQTVRWTSTGLTGTVRIDLSRDAGATWKTLFPGVANTGAQPWTPRGAATTRARMRVCSVTTPVICDASDADFTITPGTIRVTAPGGGESWLSGTSEIIRWTSSVVGDVKLQLSRDGGATWSTLVAGMPNTGAYAWTVTGPATIAARVRVCSVLLPAVCDASDGAFRITLPPPSQVRFLNSLCLQPSCTPFTARLRASEGYRWSSRSGVPSAYQNVEGTRLSDFVLTFDFTTETARCAACAFTLAPGLRYRIVLTVSGDELVLGLVFEGSVSSPHPEAPAAGAPPAPLRGVPAERFRPLP